MMLRVCVHAGAFQSLPEPTSGQPAIHSVWNTPGFLDPYLSTAGLPHGNHLAETRWRLSPGDALSWANLETGPPSGTWCVLSAVCTASFHVSQRTEVWGTVLSTARKFLWTRTERVLGYTALILVPSGDTHLLVYAVVLGSGLC